MGTPRSPYRIAYRDVLTPRQFQVLRLLARGRTNAQIGDELGIGYETVKSHVAEILGKLGVDSREEAGAMYRESNALRSRVGRMVAAMPFALGGRGLAVTGAAVVLVAAGILAGVMLLTRGDGETPATPTESPTALSTVTASATSTSSPSETPAPTVVAAPTIPSVVAGKPVKQLVPGPPVEFPPDLVLYLSTSACANCGFGFGDFWRVYRATDGELVADRPIPPGTGETSYISAYWQSQDGHDIIVGLCTGYCGGESAPSEDASLQLVRSQDGGMTWANLDVAPFTRSFVTLNGLYQGEVLGRAVKYLPSNEVERADYFLVPSMTPVDVPASVTGAPNAYPATPIFGPQGQLLWLEYPAGGKGAVYYDENGAITTLSPKFDAILPGGQWYRADLHPATSDSGAIWQALADLPDHAFFLLANPRGDVVEGYQTALRGLRFVAPLDRSRWIGAAVMPLAPGEELIGGNDNFRAVIIDTGTGLVHPLLGLPPAPSPLPDNLDWPANFSWPRLAVTGIFRRVATGGDCLNVREARTTESASLGCYADGVLLGVPGGDDPGAWESVVTPDGRHGYAAREFLE